MTSDFAITGADELQRLGRALKDAGRGELRKELNAGIRAAAKPLIPVTRAAARRTLPKRGGLAERVVRASQRVQISTGRDPGVRIVAGKAGSGARGADRGKIRHPVPRSEKWVEQPVPAGWFTETLQQQAPEALLEGVEKAMDRIVDKVVRGG